MDGRTDGQIDRWTVGRKWPDIDMQQPHLERMILKIIFNGRFYIALS